MNWNRIKKVAAAVMAAALCSPVGVYANNENVGTKAATIDTSRKGSITLYKYIDNNGTTIDGTGAAYTADSAEMGDLIKQKLNDNDIMPEKDVKFKLLKVADIQQVTNGTDGTTGTYYTNFDETFLKYVNQYSGNALTSSEKTTKEDAGATDAEKHYESDTVTAAMQKAIKANGGEEAFNAYVGNHGETEDCKAFAATDENGSAKLDNLNLGLYLITEVDFAHSSVVKFDHYWERVNGQTASSGITEDAGVTTDESGKITNNGGSENADVASPASPFLLSVPMTNVVTVNSNGVEVADTDADAHPAGTAWQYDITAYPKNATITIHKDIVDNDVDELKGDKDSAQDGNDTYKSEDRCDYNQSGYLPSGDGKNGTAIDGNRKPGLTHQIDANIGDTITQLISSDVPKLTNDIHVDGNDATAVEQKKNKTYKITDRMTKGLALRTGETPEVWLSSDSWVGGTDKISFVAGTDFEYKPSDDLKSFVITILPEGLKKMDAITKASYLYVEYHCTLTEDALIGTDTYANQRTVEDGSKLSTKSETYTTTNEEKKSGNTTYADGTSVNHDNTNNQNTAELTYATDRTSEHDYYSNTTHVYTYELDLTKTFSDGTKGFKLNAANHKTDTDESGSQFDYTAVRFTMEGSVAEGSVDAAAAANTDATEGYENLLFIRTGDGRYRVWSDKTPGTYDADADTITRSVNDINIGTTVTKYLTPNSETGLLSVTGLDARTYKLVERTTAPGRNLMAEPFYVELVAPVIVKQDGLASGMAFDHEDGSLAHAYVWTGAKPTDSQLESQDMAAIDNTKAFTAIGRAPITVQNNEVIRVLRTGGEGTRMIMLAGGMVAAAGVVLLIMRKKNAGNGAEMNA